MPSPFPGMNPFLEHPSVWQDFHQRLVTHISESLGGRVGNRYFIKIEQHIFLHELSAAERRLAGRGDVIAVHGGNGGASWAANSGGGVAVMEAPVLGEVAEAVAEERSAYLEILDIESREVVTVIEVLSPANKSRVADREQYLAKRRCILNSYTHLVEIDLLRGGPRAPVTNLPPCDYCVLVSRRETRPKVGLWPIGLREPLPVIPVPLLAPDPDVPLDLMAVLRRVYDAAGYHRYIYRHQPAPELNAEDRAWAAELASQALT